MGGLCKRTQRAIYQRMMDRADHYEKVMGRQDGKADLMRFLAKVALEGAEESEPTEERNPSED